MTRIIAGKYRGRELKVPAKGTRPTSSRVREALFSRLEHWNLIQNCDILDLCAGSGALGIEALSRGANSLDLIEKAPAAARIIQDNLRTLKIDNARVYPQNIHAFLTGAPRKYDLVFFDPPYDMPNTEIAQVAQSLAGGYLAEHSVIVIERAKRSGQPEWGSELSVLDEKSYGDTIIWFLELANEAESKETPEAAGE
ncbi:16S rRNA (guanine(966)-N(2))-methyltransferase RsmD [Boudabousia liubingyangii]|uniref:16S rRNA (Guanine(966)-N(2))-methyltransferase RsmD n=1 Tax=Boudabousia liubingyangii TaxID=1921764 RepID=A0A1Q5PN72_9ACTO|nr:16S rRNA (guanine(966)-N(2))-methyltransferase RsmD [Boudabousia liubingyangii]OKL48992.1 16S rRNA (guanine(966)-N(2))-methyltransferase RsmD [Boudabousia liubingyangii]